MAELQDMGLQQLIKSGETTTIELKVAMSQHVFNKKVCLAFKTYNNLRSTYIEPMIETNLKSQRRL
ncbi:hypothetical protein ccbrp13_50710 [Ktedonobacteria bacterium brp13]|nr:hypothetical protein ccbrp13_50710 [Ktedonobacteria bacterium brp13]